MNEHACSVWSNDVFVFLTLYPIAGGPMTLPYWTLHDLWSCLCPPDGYHKHHFIPGIEITTYLYTRHLTSPESDHTRAWSNFSKYKGQSGERMTVLCPLHSWVLHWGIIWKHPGIIVTRLISITSKEKSYIKVIKGFGGFMSHIYVYCSQQLKWNIPTYPSGAPHYVIKNSVFH